MSLELPRSGENNRYGIILDIGPGRGACHSLFFVVIKRNVQLDARHPAFTFD